MVSLASSIVPDDDADIWISGGVTSIKLTMNLLATIVSKCFIFLLVKTESEPLQILWPAAQAIKNEQDLESTIFPSFESCLI